LEGMDYDNFIREWLRRAERAKVRIDDADRFISLWIAFNAWLKKEYGERTSDSVMIRRAKRNNGLKETFRELSASDGDFQKNLRRLMGYSVIDMRDHKNEQRQKRCTGDYESFLDTVYQIRCNLFHGRKNIEENKRDKELVTLALKLLHPLFKKSIESYMVGLNHGLDRDLLWREYPTDQRTGKDK